jgi:hypothetical protein
MIKYILYVSEVADHCGDRETKDILVTSRSNNNQNSVTGMLVRKEKEFLQYIEGSSDSVDMLFKKIETDDRHRSVKVVKQGMTSDRVFFNWEMAFADERNFQPLQWKWQLDKISLFSLADDAEDCLTFVKAFLGTPQLAANSPLS